jgi:DNA-binding NtrC family response regulator
MARILVVDDEPGIRRALTHVLAHAGHEVVEADSGDAALERLAAGDGHVDLVLTDLMMPGRDGLETLAELRRRDPSVPCILMTAHGSVRTAVRAMRAGAFDYVPKPFDNDDVLLTVERALEMRRLSSELEAARAALAATATSGIVGASGAMQAVRDAIRQAAASDETVLITGETGTGKELVARAIHRASARGRRHTIVTADCGVLPSDLVASELFGTERGAYTGADRTRKGLFEQAAGSTLFLDEVGNLPMDVQPALLRVLQERTIRRLGGQEEIAVDVRVIAATNEPLTGPHAEQRFRRDLYYRLNIIAITLPSLRDRREDIPLLTNHFVSVICDTAGRPPKPVSDEVRDLLLAHAWPGNIRELENALKRAVAMGDGEAIVARDLPLEIRGSVAGRTDPLSDGEGTLSLAEEVKAVSERHERRRIRETLQAVDGNRLEAAARLGLPSRTFYRKLKQYGLAQEGDDPEPGS